MFKILYFIMCYAFMCHVLKAQETLKAPTVVIAILARNKAHTLPYFLSMLEKLNYPKNRLCLWIRSDHNSDNTIEIMQLWVDSVRDEYHYVDSILDDDTHRYRDETGPADWPPDRFDQMIEMREEALKFARLSWADYILFLDCDVFFVNMDILHHLISKNLPVVGPMLKSDGLYSNFWAGMTSSYYYERTEEYKPILSRENIGCHSVPMIHSCVLIDLKRAITDFLTFNPDKVVNYDGPRDDIITFALSANKSDISLHVCNDEIYGFVTVPLEQGDNLEMDIQQFVNIKLEILTEHEPLPLNNILKPFFIPPEKDKLGFDNIFMINLLRRPERRKRMIQAFTELGLQVEIRDAIDGNQLNDTQMQALEFLPGYSDPYHKRPMKLGEIGCFLSHYEIWKEMLTRNYKTILVLEDDIRFEPFFRSKTTRLLKELKNVDWDLVYLGRKPMASDKEAWVPGSSVLVHAGYSYWTLGYALSESGAKKLLEADPLHHLLPVDEFLPILFDAHPRDDWKSWFPRRDLHALSAAPLLLYPTHYTGEQGYVSDTEDSNIAQDSLHTEF